MGKARVNIVDISNFKRRVNDFASGVKEFNSSVNYEISSIDTSIKKDINKLEESIAKCQKSMEHAKNKLQELEKEQEKLEKEREELEKEREDLEKELNDLKRELENIPKTIVVLEPIGTDDKGNTIYREVEKPNPEFINLTDKLLDFNNDYSEICDNISEICNDISTIKIKTDELNKLKNDLENIISCINNSMKIYQRTMSDLNNCSKKIDEYCRNISNKSDMADSQLQKAITAIQKYKDEKIHINPVPSHKSINWTTPLSSYPLSSKNEMSNSHSEKNYSNHDIDIDLRAASLKNSKEFNGGLDIDSCNRALEYVGRGNLKMVDISSIQIQDSLDENFWSFHGYSENSWRGGMNDYLSMMKDIVNGILASEKISDTAEAYLARQNVKSKCQEDYNAVWHMIFGEQPIQLSKNEEGKLIITNGRHRIAMAQKLGISYLPAILY